MRQRGRQLVDLERVRRALERLDRIAAAHPELLGPRSKANAKRWEQLLEERMAVTTKQITFRLEPELIERLDRGAEILSAQTPGLTLTRTDALRILLTRSLDALEEQATPKKKR